VEKVGRPGGLGYGCGWAPSSKGGGSEFRDRDAQSAAPVQDAVMELLSWS
jgi:hypothetical protein